MWRWLKAGILVNFSFPCRGYMIGVGASAGILGSILGMDITGGGLTIALSGQVPVFAGIRLWGFGAVRFPELDSPPDWRIFG